MLYPATKWLPLILVLILVLWRSFFFELHDFSNAYFAAYFLELSSFDSEIYDALSFNQNLVHHGFLNYFVAYYPNTPFLAFFFLPFSYFFSPENAKLCFNLVSCFLFIFSLFRLKKIIDFPDIILLFLPIVFFAAIKNNLYFGQVYFLILFLISEGIIACYKNENIDKIKLSFFWGLAILLKVFPVLFALFLVIQRAFKTLFFLLGFVAFLVVFSYWKINLSEWYYYLTEVFPKSSNGEYYDGFTPKANSAIMLFKNLFIEDEILNPKPFLDSHLVYILIQTIYKAGIIGSLVVFSWKKTEHKAVFISLWMIGAMLLSPGWSSYASILLVLPFLVVWSLENISLKNKVLFSIFVGIYCNIPVQYFGDLPLLLKFPKVYLLLGIFAYYWYLVREKNLVSFSLKFGIFSLFFTLFLALGFFNKKSDSNNYVLEKEEHILIADYDVKNGYLEYKYWDIPEPKTIRTNLAINSFSSNDLTIQNHQIFYKGKQITDNKSKKRKPTLINEKEIIYLSDQNRGIGFYTLLKIPCP